MKIADSLFSILALVSPVLLGAQATDPKIIEAAKKEGRIIWYTSMAVDQSQPQMNAFQKKYPAIKPVLVRSGGGAIMNRVLTETRAGMFGFDVVGGRGEMIQIFKERGILAPYISPETKLIDPDLFDRQGCGYVPYVVPWALGYNISASQKGGSAENLRGAARCQMEGRQDFHGQRRLLDVQGVMTAWAKRRPSIT